MIRVGAGCRRWGVALVIAVSLVALGGGRSAALADNDPLPGTNLNPGHAPAPDAGAVYGGAPFTKTGTAICTTQTSSAANVNTDCEPTAEHAETSIAVDPTDPDHLIGGVYDSQLALTP